MAKILIVDDSPTETYKLISILERNGFSVLSADSGEQGVRHWAIFKARNSDDYLSRG